MLASCDAYCFFGNLSIFSLPRTAVQLISCNKSLTSGFCSFLSTKGDATAVGDLVPFRTLMAQEEPPSKRAFINEKGLKQLQSL